MTEVIWPGAARWERNALVARLQEELRGRVVAAYLFGSYARDNADDDSDIDLIIVINTKLPWSERVEAFADLSVKMGAIDIIVYSTEEWRRFKTQPTPFIEKIREEWLQLF